MHMKKVKTRKWPQLRTRQRITTSFDTCFNEKGSRPTRRPVKSLQIAAGLRPVKKLTNLLLAIFYCLHCRWFLAPFPSFWEQFGCSSVRARLAVRERIWGRLRVVGATIIWCSSTTLSAQLQRPTRSFIFWSFKSDQSLDIFIFILDLLNHSSIKLIDF
jgi:hypothetical protein